MPYRTNAWLSLGVALALAIWMAFSSPQAAKSALAAPAGVPSAISLYKMSMAASDTVSYSGRQFITTWRGGDQSTTLVTHVDHKAPLEYRMTLLAPASRAGRAIVENAHWQWTYSPADGVVIRSAKPVTAQDEPEIQLLLANYSLSVDPTPRQIAERKTWLVTVSSRYRPGRVLRYWIDAYTGFALRTERYHAGGAVASVSYFSEINFHPMFDESTFSPSQWPQGVVKYIASLPAPMLPLAQARIKQSLRGHVLMPARVGEFHLTSVTSMAGPRQTVHLHYSDGLSTLSLFETLKTNRVATNVPHTRLTQIDALRMGHASQQYSYSVLSWDEGRLNLTLVGDTNIATLRDLASLVVASSKSPTKQ